MNQALHPDFHPDAESLNAFMEHALPPPERAQILAHIVACSQCRQTVFLSQQAATAADAPPAPTIVNQPVPWSRNWRLNWHLVWAPAMAFALIVAVAVFVRIPRPAQPTEMARTTPPAPTPQQSITATAARQPAQPPSAKSAKKSAASDAFRELGKQPVPPPGYPGAIAGEIGTASSDYAERAQNAPASAAFGNGTPANAPAALKSEPAVEALQQQQRVASEFSRAAKSARTAQAQFTAKVEATQSPQGMIKPQAATPETASKSLHVSSFEPSPPTSAEYQLAAAKPVAVKLPSGLTPVAIATAQHRTVAIDPDGNLYLRDGASESWESVARQWTGRPTRVRVQWLLESKGGGNASDHSTLPAPAFEMVNDSNLVWASEDGKTWKAQ